MIVRGNNRNRIFFDAQDYRRFLTQLDRRRERFRVELLAYALMPNHFHLAVLTPMGNLDRFMQSLDGTFAIWLNRRYGRVGTPYQGRYKAFTIRGDANLLQVVRYIHENPIRANVRESLPWTSDRAYREIRAAALVQTDRVLNLFSQNRSRAFERYAAMMDDPSAGAVDLASLHPESLDGTIQTPTTPSSDRSIAQPPSAMRAGPPRSIPSERGIETYQDASVRVAAESFRVSPDVLAGPGGPHAWLPARRWAAYLIVRHFGFRANGAARTLGRGNSTISRWLATTDAELRDDADARTRLQSLRTRLSSSTGTSSPRPGK